MKKLLPLLLAATFAISAADAPRLNRTLVTTVEKRLDERIQRMWTDNPMALVGNSRGVYLPGYGIVFSAEMTLATANISLMNPTLTDADKVALHKKKLERLPQLKAAMKEALIATAASLDPVPAYGQSLYCATPGALPLGGPYGRAAASGIRGDQTAVIDGAKGRRGGHRFGHQDFGVQLTPHAPG
jgi:hypothetical protein